MPDLPAELTAALSALAIAVVSLSTLFVQKVGKTVVQKISKRIDEHMTPNGGSSMRDSVDRIERNIADGVRQIDARFAKVEQRLSDLEEAVTTPDRRNIGRPY